MKQPIPALKLLLLLPLGIGFVTACAGSSSSPIRSAVSATPPARAALTNDHVSRARDYVDRRAKQWLKESKCVSCHTVLPYTLGRLDPSALETETFQIVDEHVKNRVATFASSDPWYHGTRIEESKATESVVNAFILTQFDTLRGLSQPSSETRMAFEWMRSTQGADGSWKWLNFSMEPWESFRATTYGASLAAIALARSSEALRSENREMLEKLKKYLQTAQLASDTNLWDRISILWAESELHGILSTEQVEEVLAELLSKQLPDGGWSMNTLGNWQKQGSRAVSAADASDGYATAYLMYVLKRLQQSEVLPSLLSLSFSRAEQRGLQWLLTHQNASGEWSSASLNRDLDRNHTFVEDAATGFGLAVLHPTR